MKKETLFKIITIAIGLVFGLLLAEGGFRIYHYLNYYDLSDIDQGARVEMDSPEEEKTLGQVIQRSVHPRVIYELLPSARYQFQGVLVETSAQGFRDKEYPAKKEVGTRRVIGLGDSVMFGWGVEEKQTYLSKVENGLNRQDSLPWEMINTGVPGYNAAMEVALLEAKIDQSQVDLVIINFVGNDFDLPNFIQKKPAYWGIQKSFILEHFNDKNGFDERLREAPFDAENWRFQRNPAEVPEEYRDMVGEEAYIASLRRLKQLSEQQQFQVIVLSHSPFVQLPDFLPTTCQQLGFEFVDVKPHWDAYVQEHPQAEWKIGENDWHPSIEGHEVIADVLQARITVLFQNNLTPPSDARPPASVY
ncbi:MAG: GDSL-type esterase/lipase family protein [Bacteroidota bacterium]